MKRKRRKRKYSKKLNKDKKNEILNLKSIMIVFYDI